MNNPLITIGISVFNRSDYITEAVISVLNQTYSNIEVLISQDPCNYGLNKSIQELITNIAKTDSRIICLCNDQNLGLAGNWNAIVNAASGEYLHIMGDDDRLLPDFIEKLIAAKRGMPGVIFSNHYIIDASGSRLNETSMQCTERYSRNKISAGIVEFPHTIAWQGAIPICASLIKVSDLKRLLFRTDLNTPEIEFFVRLSKDDTFFVFEPAYLTEYRIHSASATSNGLWIDKLVSSLLAINVSTEVEPYKNNLINNLMITAVTQSLLKGDHDVAKKFATSGYYPAGLHSWPKKIIQLICVSIPPRLGIILFRLAYSLSKL